MYKYQVTLCNLVLMHPQDGLTQNLLYWVTKPSVSLAWKGCCSKTARHVYGVFNQANTCPLCMSLRWCHCSKSGTDQVRN